MSETEQRFMEACERGEIRHPTRRPRLVRLADFSAVVLAFHDWVDAE